MNVAAWLHELGMEQYVQAFEDNDVDEQTLGLLTEADLVDMGVVSVGHRRRLADAIAALAGEPAAPPSAMAAAPIDAEQRQLTVLYCQMVGPAAQPRSKADPEARRRVIQDFHKACMRVVAEYDGHVANFFGDCVLAYFGWPRAHEDDAEGAVRAGLALVNLGPAGGAPGARVGIATGPVVVGNLIDDGPAQEQSAVGVAPNLAARLLALAAPGQIVVDEQTRRLLEKSFALQPLGEHVLKGIALPVPAYGVSGERAGDTRFDAHKGQDLALMIGRDQELALLLERWALTQGGEGQAVLLVGEAGIGKSRLTRAVLDACAAQPHWRIRWQCSAYHTGSALWPVIERLSRTAGVQAQDSAEAALDKLEALVGKNEEGKEATAVYAKLLGLDGTQRYGPLEMTPQMLRERTLELLVEQLLEMAEQRTLLLVVEDAHWIDPTTLELIDRCLERIDSAHMLMLITSRPDNQPSLGAHTSVTRLSLNRLSRASVEAIVARLGGESLQAQTRAAIVAQTDGVPLFVEELTKAVLETAGAAIPASLHGSLMARLDRIPEVKEVAQIAACIGREFDLALVEAVAERPEAVCGAIDKLAAAELIFRRGDKANPRFTFKHALVQEAAHESLLRSKRQAIHLRILEALESERADTPSEILAHHAQRAKRADKAIGYWQQAGDAALAKSAYVEATGYLESAIELIQAHSDGIDRRTQELELQLSLGQAHIAAHGFGAELTKKAFMRAYDFLEANPMSASYVLRVHYGLWAWHLTRAEVEETLRLATRTLAAAQADGDPEVLLYAHRMVAGSHMHLGDFAEARVHFERAMVFLNSAKRDELTAAHFGVDPAVATLCYFAWTLCIQGLAEQSAELDARARRIGSALSQVSARMQMHLVCAVRAACARDHCAMAADAEALADLAMRHRLSMYSSYADVLINLGKITSARPDEGAVRSYERSLSKLAAGGTRIWVPFFVAQLAAGLAACGHQDEAMQTIEEALVECGETAQGWCDAELWRVRGELMLSGPHGDAAQAARSFERALTLARAHGAKLWELRAAMSLARLCADQGDSTKALKLLAPIHDWFTEGFDTPDLVEATMLLGKFSVAPREN